MWGYLIDYFVLLTGYFVGLFIFGNAILPILFSFPTALRYKTHNAWVGSFNTIIFVIPFLIWSIIYIGALSIMGSFFPNYFPFFFTGTLVSVLQNLVILTSYDQNLNVDFFRTFNKKVDLDSVAKIRNKSLDDYVTNGFFSFENVVSNECPVSSFNDMKKAYVRGELDLVISSQYIIRDTTLYYSISNLFYKFLITGTIFLSLFSIASPFLIIFYTDFRIGVIGFIIGFLGIALGQTVFTKKSKTPYGPLLLAVSFLITTAIIRQNIVFIYLTMQFLVPFILVSFSRYTSHGVVKRAVLDSEYLFSEFYLSGNLAIIDLKSGKSFYQE